ncbi:xanthotoxin 5-hydroxylase CYP82C4-like [Pistacia vera]|uniref:xanthotoxin 5-hydroxylase CYP82C4-like n=1 Tax=Pistacia vera TaxID=55513 RepID=UPI001263394A|nr:xanthotoxin 5-hydroxylase CYP82C4-like [Pistacia vera]
MGFYLQLRDTMALLALVFAIIFLCVIVKTAKGSKNKGRRPPEPAGAWPFIGHLHLLGSNQLLHRTFGAMADKYGPTLLIHLGIHQVLVISSWEVAKECFTVNDRIFPTRPRYFAIKLMGYDHAMFGFAPYGPYWREIRKLVAVEILSNRRLELLKHVRDTEINCFIEGLYKKSVKNGGLVAVDLKERFGDLAMNIIVRLMAGKRYFGTDASGDDPESRRCQKALGDFFYFVGLFLASDAVPCLGWLDYVKGYVGEMKRTARELDSIFESWVQEHHQKRLNRNINEEEHDLIDVMLSIMDEGRISAQDDAHTVIKATCLSLILGGNDTTVVTLTWVISLLLNNRHVLKKAQDELNVHVGKHRQVEESDIKNLIYLQAIVKETLRLYPALPLSAPRKAMEDCTISGFHIPAGTHLVVNLWKLQRDPSIWSNPSEFIPERFLNDHAKLDFNGQDFEYIPFGSGRRKCPGISFALQVLHLTLARLLHAFELGTVSDTPVDMTEGPGLTVPKATPLEVTLTPRLDSICYSSTKN